VGVSCLLHRIYTSWSDKQSFVFVSDINAGMAGVPVELIGSGAGYNLLFMGFGVRGDGVYQVWYVFYTLSLLGYPPLLLIACSSLIHIIPSCALTCKLVHFSVQYEHKQRPCLRVFVWPVGEREMPVSSFCILVREGCDTLSIVYHPSLL